MTPQNAPFSQAEYDRRIALTRAAMAKAGLDAIFVTDPSNQTLLTGYDVWSFYVHQGAILTMTGEPHWWGLHMDSLGAMLTCWFHPLPIHGYPDSYVQSTVRHPMQDLALNMRKIHTSYKVFYIIVKAGIDVTFNNNND